MTIGQQNSSKMSKYENEDTISHNSINPWLDETNSGLKYIARVQL